MRISPISEKLQQSILTEHSIKGRALPHRVITVMLVCTAYGSALGLLAKHLLYP